MRQALELGELVHLDTASEEFTDEFLLFAIQSGLLAKWAEAFPDPREEPEIGMAVILASHLAARFAGLYSASIMASATPFCFCATPKHITIGRARGSSI